MSRVDEKRVWERGVALPGGGARPPAKGKLESITSEKRVAKLVDSPKIRPQLAPVPKVNPWGNKPKPAAVSLKTDASVAPKANSAASSSAVKQELQPTSRHKPPSTTIVASAWGKIPGKPATPVLDVPALQKEATSILKLPKKETKAPLNPSKDPQRQHQQHQFTAVLQRPKDSPWGQATVKSNRPVVPKQQPGAGGSKSAPPTDHHSAKPKGKKRKPKFGSMSVSDLIPNNHAALRTEKTAPAAAKPHLDVSAASFQPASSEFPTLDGGGAGKRSVPAAPAIVHKKQTTVPAIKQNKKAASVPSASPKPRPKKKKKPANQSLLAGMPLQAKDDKPVQMDAHHSAAALDGFFPTPGEKHGDQAIDLARLYSEGKVQKGRQRLRPRKKKFSSLKKKVLEERLRNWKELHPDKKVDEITFSSVCLYGYCEQEELEDDDEYEEIVANLLDMANKVGSTRRVFIPRTLDCCRTKEDGWPVFVDFESDATVHAAAAVECWNGLVLGGQKLKCCPLQVSDSAKLVADDTEWQQECVTAEQSVGSKSEDVVMEDAEVGLTDILLLNALTEEDLEDKDCMEESLNDIRILVSKYGEVEKIEVLIEPTPPFIRCTYRLDVVAAKNAAVLLSKVVIGGQQVVAKLAIDSSSAEKAENTFFVRLQNVLTEDDLEDEDCLEESLNDLRELAQQFGVVKDTTMDEADNVNSSNAGEQTIRLYFSTIAEAKAGAKGFDGMIIGGLTVAASLPDGLASDGPGEEIQGVSPPEVKEPEQMMSGDKIIPERFAECKRVPKIINREPRKYATISTDETVKPLLIEMLGELMRLQRRAIEDKNTKAKRRIVMGLREVARGIRAHKVKMVVMANNLDEYGIIDEKLQDILDLSHEEGVPVFYEFSKRTLGKALGKSIKIAVAAVQNAEGAHQPFKKLVNIASKMGL